MNATKTPPELTDSDFARIANEIHRVGEIGKKLTASGLSRRAIRVLLHDATGVPMKTIGQVLDALPELSRIYLAKAAGR